MGRNSPAPAPDNPVPFLELAPAGALLVVPPAMLLEWLRGSHGRERHAEESSGVARAETWRERLWTVPDETLMSVLDVAEAVGKSKHWVYRRTSAVATDAILPHRKLDGSLVFRAGEVRDWVRDHMGGPRRTATFA